MEERGGGVAPALGLAWASLVTSRITLSRDETVHSNLDCCKVLSSSPALHIPAGLSCLYCYTSILMHRENTSNLIHFILAAD